MNTQTLYESPAVMVALAYAAKKAGDREAVRIVRQALKTKFGITLTFKPHQAKQGAKQ